MNVLRWLFKPRPEPALVLLAIILTIFGVMMTRLTTALGAPLIVSALILLVNFARGLKQDLEVAKIGIVVTATITRVEQQSGTYSGKRYDVWHVHYTFQDLQGIQHEDFIPIDDREEARKYHAGGTVQLRYHPDNPEIFRWLG